MSADPNGMESPEAAVHGRVFHRALGLFDSVMIVSGTMVGSGIFIVSAEISRQVGSAGWLLVAFSRCEAIWNVFG